ncbi:MBL fold metallo-hydrolase [Motilimonas sp. KMU-193]|uniref:MBL fold metallo-hydrolase n=1 Tax=Motilimonas sp. KMU-193 TaxID=3388668 RepID=UPI00396B10BA
MKKRYLALATCSLTILLSAIAISQTRTTDHDVNEQVTGQLTSQAVSKAVSRAVSKEQMLAALSQGNKVDFTRISSADWQVPLSGLVNLNHPKAKQAKLVDKNEAIQIFAYHIKHPSQGDYLIDTGVSQALFDDPSQFGINNLLQSLFGFAQLSMTQSTQDYLEHNQIKQVDGVFLTHLHLDHVTGLPDINLDAPIYVGNNEGQSRYWMNVATKHVINLLLKGRPALQQWQGEIVDIFADGSAFALHMPGHTPGSTAYLVNAKTGPVLVVGDVSHTRWGWDNQVEPGDFTRDQQQNQTNLLQLKLLAQQLKHQYPSTQVMLGHQN